MYINILKNAHFHNIGRPEEQTFLCVLPENALCNVFYTENVRNHKTC